MKYILILLLFASCGVSENDYKYDLSVDMRVSMDSLRGQYQNKFDYWAGQGNEDSMLVYYGMVKGAWGTRQEAIKILE